jgi:hypothetical protein
VADQALAERIAHHRTVRAWGFFFAFVSLAAGAVASGGLFSPATCCVLGSGLSIAYHHGVLRALRRQQNLPGPRETVGPAEPDVEVHRPPIHTHGTAYWLPAIADPAHPTAAELAGGIPLDAFITDDGFTFGDDPTEPAAPESTWPPASSTSWTAPMQVTWASPEARRLVFGDLVRFPVYEVRITTAMPESWRDRTARIHRARRARALRRAYDGPRRTRRRRARTGRRP